MKKLFVALMLIAIALFTATAAFANDYDYVPQFIDVQVTLNGEPISMLDNCFLRTGDEVTVKVTSLNDANIDFVYVSHCDLEDQFDTIDILGAEEINSKTFEATAIIDENEVGTRRWLCVDACLVGEYSDDTYYMSCYIATWLPGEKTIGSSFGDMNSYSFIKNDTTDEIFNINAINIVKPDDLLHFFDTCETDNSNYVFDFFSVEVNGYTLVDVEGTLVTTQDPDFYLDISDAGENTLNTVRLFTHYSNVNNPNDFRVCWKTYTFVVMK